MACDVEANRRRRLWESDQAALSSEKGGIGFANKGHPAKQVWVEWDADPIPPFWDWVDDYRLLTDMAGSPSPGLNYVTDQTPLGFDLFILSSGFTEPRTDMLGNPFTVALAFQCLVTEVSDQIVTVYRHFSAIHLFAPLPTDSYRFEIWANFVNEVEIGAVLPGCTVYPLDRCHNCSD